MNGGPWRIAAVVLAAGQSRRMGEVNKLLTEVEGRPMVARAVDAALASRAEPVVLVTGYQARAVVRALAERPVIRVHNPKFADGMGSSLACAIETLPETADGAIICLADMPRIAAHHLDRLADAFEPGAICVPVHGGRRGNPVLFPRAFFPQLLSIAGDRGARDLLQANPGAVRRVAMDDDAVLVDIDRAADLEVEAHEVQA